MKIRNVVKHFCLVTRHRWEVFKLTCRMGIPLQGLLHDLSKYSPTEFWESAKYFDGHVSPIWAARRENGYSKAWLHHKGRNKHHPEYWYDNSAKETKPIIPYQYLCETVCDQIAAGRTYQGKNWTKEYPLTYWNEHKHELLANDKIKDFLTAAYEQLAEEGLDKTLTKQNIYSLYEKICLETKKGS